MVIFGLLGLNKNVRKIFKRKKMVMGWHGSRMTSQEVGMFIEWRDLAWPHGTVHLGCSGGGDGRDEDGHRGRSHDDEVPATWALCNSGTVLKGQSLCLSSPWPGQWCGSREEGLGHLGARGSCPRNQQGSGRA